MKKFLIILAAWAFAITATLGGLYIHKQNQAEEYDVTVIPYLKDIVPELSKWNPEITGKLMVAEVIEAIPEDTFRQAINIFARLGALKEMSEPEFDKILTEKATKSGRKTVIVYTVDAIYEKGAAELSINLIENSGGYEIFHFNISSEALAE